MSLFDQVSGPPPAAPVRASRPAATAVRAMRATNRQPPRGPLPSWLQKRMEAEGHMDFSQGGPVATRRARAIFCPDCHRFVMRGLLEMPMPWAIDCDPEPLTAEGEALAMLAGRRTYQLRWVGTRYELSRRDYDRIVFKPITYNQGFDVLVEHQHGERTSDHYPTQPTQVPDPRDEHQMLPDEPPF